jgi:hypothetical protein
LPWSWRFEGIIVHFPEKYLIGFKISQAADYFWFIGLAYWL